MNDNPIRLTIGMREGKPYGIDNVAPPPGYREDKCGIDLLEPYCSSTCPHDCISGQWESVHAKPRTKMVEDNIEEDGYDVITSNNNFISIECGKLLIQRLSMLFKNNFELSFQEYL